jgi:hypothetical protein
VYLYQKYRFLTPPTKIRGEKMEIRENGYYYDIDEYSDEVEIEIKNSQV